MDDLGCFVDDDFFENSNRTKKLDQKSQKYSPKICENQWFLTNEDTSGDDSTIWKYKADFYYSREKYGECLKFYKQALEAATNTTVRRDCLEGISRSSLKLNCLTVAISYAELMYEESCNTFQKSNASNLLATVYHAAERYEDELSHLQRLMIQDEWNADVWLRLAMAYANLCGLPLPCACASKQEAEMLSSTQPHDICPEVHRFDPSCSCLACPCVQHRRVLGDEYPDCWEERSKIFACIYRCRWLLESYQSVNRSFAEKRYSLGPQKLTHLLNALGMDEHFYDIVQKQLIDDRREADCFSDGQDENQVSFDTKWFWWIKEDNSRDKK